MTDSTGTAVDVRDIAIGDVTWKVQATSKPDASNLWAMWVPYADARVYGERLDAWAGEFGWSDAYSFIDVDGHAGVECAITIHRDTDITDLQHARHIVRHGWAEIDNGRETVKGAESDSFKRAGAKCGIGRNLYRLPKQYTNATKGSDGKIYPVKKVGDVPVEEWLAAQVVAKATA